MAPRCERIWSSRTYVFLSRPEPGSVALVWPWRHPSSHHGDDPPPHPARRWAPWISTARGEPNSDFSIPAHLVAPRRRCGQVLRPPSSKIHHVRKQPRARRSAYLNLSAGDREPEQRIDESQVIASAAAANAAGWWSYPGRLTGRVPAVLEFS